MKLIQQDDRRVNVTKTTLQTTVGIETRQTLHYTVKERKKKKLYMWKNAVNS